MTSLGGWPRAPRRWASLPMTSHRTTVPPYHGPQQRVAEAVRWYPHRYCYGSSEVHRQQLRLDRQRLRLDRQRLGLEPAAVQAGPAAAQAGPAATRTGPAAARAGPAAAWAGPAAAGLDQQPALPARIFRNPKIAVEISQNWTSYPKLSHIKSQDISQGFNTHSNSNNVYLTPIQVHIWALGSPSNTVLYECFRLV